MRKPDITVARTVLGWTPEHTLRAGLERTIPYFRRRVEQDDAQARPLEVRARLAG